MEAGPIPWSSIVMLGERYGIRDLAGLERFERLVRIAESEVRKARAAKQGTQAEALPDGDAGRGAAPEL